MGLMSIAWEKKMAAEGAWAPPGEHWYRALCTCGNCHMKRQTETISSDVIKDRLKKFEQKERQKKQGRRKKAR